MRTVITFFILSALVYCGSTVTDDDLKNERQKMVDLQIARRGVTDQAVLRAMKTVPRHRFVSPSLRTQAYGDYPLPIGKGQTISQPYIVAVMTEMLRLSPKDKVLEIGTGSGYQAAVLGQIAREVFSIEIHPSLAEQAATILKDLNYTNISVKQGDGYFGWKEHAPFDAIIITASANKIPLPLIRQLKEGGRLVVPLEKIDFYQELTLFIKQGKKNIVKKAGAVRFVPMTGAVRKQD